MPMGPESLERGPFERGVGTWNLWSAVPRIPMQMILWSAVPRMPMDLQSLEHGNNFLKRGA